MNFKKSNFVKLVVACAILATQSNVALANVEKQTNAAQEQFAFIQNRVIEVEQLREEIANLQVQIDERMLERIELEADANRTQGLVGKVYGITAGFGILTLLAGWDTAPKGQSSAKSLAHLLKYNAGKVIVLVGGVALTVLAADMAEDKKVEVQVAAEDLTQLKVNLQRAEMRLQHESRALTQLIDLQKR